MDARMLEVVRKARETVVERAGEIKVNRFLEEDGEKPLAGRIHNSVYRLLTDRTPGRWSLAEGNRDDQSASDQLFGERRDVAQKKGWRKMLFWRKSPKGMFTTDPESGFRYRYDFKHEANLRIYVTLKEHNRGNVGRYFIDLINRLENKGISVLTAKAVMPTVPTRRESMVLYLNIPGVRENPEKNRALLKALKNVEAFLVERSNHLFPQEQKELPLARVHNQDYGVTWALHPTETEARFYEEATGIREDGYPSYNAVLSALVTPAVLRELAKTRPGNRDELVKEAERIESVIARYQDKIRI